LQSQSAACLAVTGDREIDPGQLPQRRDGAVAVGDLNEKQTQRHQRRQEPLAPHHLVGVEEAIQVIGDGKISERIAPETRKQLRHLSHPWPPVHR
jgi:hypothetical protein